MWLLIDAGNTRIKWALAEKLRPLSPWQPHNDIDAGWLATGAVTHADMTTLAGLWQGRGISQVVVSNVAGVAAREQLAQLLQQAVAPAPTALHWFSSVALAAGLRNGYRDPNQLGGDRFASLIGARALFPAHPFYGGINATPQMPAFTCRSYRYGGQTTTNCTPY